MFENGIEQVTIRLTGGPFQGNRIVPINQIGGNWPLPNKIKYEGGEYIKIRESELTAEQANHPNVCRGAEYKWQTEIPKYEGYTDEN